MLCVVLSSALIVTGTKLQAWKLCCVTAAKQVWMLCVNYKDGERWQGECSLSDTCVQLWKVQIPVLPLVSRDFQESIIFMFACKEHHQLHHCWWVVSVSEWSWKIQSKWSSQGWANRVSTCQPKQFHVWMNKGHSVTYLLRWLHHFLKNTSCGPSLTDDTVSPSGSLLQLQSFVSDFRGSQISLTYCTCFVRLDSTIDC